MARSIWSMALTVVLLASCTVARPASETPDASIADATFAATPTPPPTPQASAPMTPRPPVPPEALPSDPEPELANAIRRRRDYGMRSDLAYVRIVANDPRASADAYGWPVYPEEFTETQGRYGEDQDVIKVVLPYTTAHADEFGGVYIEEETHSGVVTLWTDHIEALAAAIREAVGPSARVAFGTVRYPEAELRKLQEQISEGLWEKWIANVPASFEHVGVDIIASQVVIGISSANPDADRIVAEHYGLGDRLRVESDGTGRALIPWGTVKGRVMGISGREAWQLNLRWTSEDSVGECGGGDMGFGISDEGRFELPCQVGTWTISVVTITGDDTVRELGHGTVKVVAGTTVTLDIRVSASP